MNTSFTISEWLQMLGLGFSMAVTCLLLVFRPYPDGTRRIFDGTSATVLLVALVLIMLVSRGLLLGLNLEPRLWSCFLLATGQFILAWFLLNSLGVRLVIGLNTLSPFELRELRYDLYGGHEKEVANALLNDARDRDRMDRYEKLSRMTRHLSELELQAGFDPSKKTELFYERQHIRKQLEDMLLDDMR